MEEPVRVKINLDCDSFIVRIQDNPTSRELLSMLPITLTFEDYAGNEKISRLSKKLTTEDAPAGFKPSAGDFAYYAPWGNLAIFYKDFGFSVGLIKLGSLESGIGTLRTRNGEFTVTMDFMDV